MCSTAQWVKELVVGAQDGAGLQQDALELFPSPPPTQTHSGSRLNHAPHVLF